MSNDGDRPQQPAAEADAEAEAEAGNGGESGPNSDRADLRDRFRAALERKKGNPSAGGSRASDAPHPHSAPAKAKRTFRRKSG